MSLTKITSDGITDGTIVGTDLATNVDFVDNQKLRLGTGNDLEIYHDGADSYIKDAGTGDLKILTSNFDLRNAAGTETLIDAFENGAVELYYDNSKKFETTSIGVDITGTTTDDGARHDGDVYFIGATSGQNAVWDMSDNALEFADNARIRLGTGSDVSMYHDGSNSYIKNFTGNFEIRTDEFRVKSQSGSNEAMIQASKEGEVQLYYNNSKKFETNNTGSTLFCTGNGNNEGPKIEGSSSMPAILNFQADAGAANADKCRFYGHQSGGSLLLQDFSAGSFQNMAKFNFEGSVELYHDGYKNLEVIEDGLWLDNDAAQNTIYLASQGTTRGYIFAQSDIGFKTAANEWAVQISNNADVSLFYDGNKKFETTTNGGEITGRLDITGGYLSVDDNYAVLMGTDGDAQLYHSGTHQYLLNTTGNIYLMPKAGEIGVTVIPDGAVELYHNNQKKFNTRAAGIDITGDLRFDSSVTGGIVRLRDDQKIFCGSGDDLQIYHDGSNSFIQDAGTGTLKILSNQTQIINAANSENIANFTQDGAVELYHNNLLKFGTDSAGVFARGDLMLNYVDNYKIKIGAGNDLQIYHDGSNTYQTNTTGYLFLQSDSISLAGQSAGQNYLVANLNGAVTLGHSGNTKLATTSSGIDVTGAITVNGSALTSGKILQVVTKRITGTTSFNSTSFGDVSGYDASITPSSTSSKIFVMFNLNAGSNNNGNRIKLRVTRTGDNSEFVGDASGSRTRCSAMFATSSPSDSRNTTIHYISTPSSTSQVTYQLQAELQVGGGSQVFFGRSGTDSNSSIEGRTANQITLMEVAG